jgi:hypothetical protein
MRRARESDSQRGIRREWISYGRLGSISNGRPSVERNRLSGDSVISFDADWVECWDISVGAPPHIFGQSSMGNGASSIDGGIIALNCTNAVLL